MSELQETPAQENVLDNGLDMKTLFVRSIPMDVTDEQLTEFFSNVAPTKHAVVVKDTNNQINKKKFKTKLTKLCSNFNPHIYPIIIL